MAIGIPLLLCVAVESRRLLTQALATAALPVMALAAFYTLSRGGAVEVAAALIAFLTLYPRRLAALPTLGLAALGSTLLIAAATQRDALEDGLTSQTALSQGDEMLAVVLVVCAGVALVRVALGLAARHGLGPKPRVSRKTALAGFGVAALVSLAVALVAGVPGELSDSWEEFKQPIGPEGTSAERFESVSGNGRYQYWQAALDANATDPLIGIGPGTYEYFWAQEGTLPGFVRDAHSLYLETLAELGIVGLALIVALVAGVLGYGLRRALSVAEPARPWVAAATAACAAFAVAAAIDWAWELAVIPVCFLLLAAAILGGGRDEAGRDRVQEPARAAPHIALAVLALAALAAIAIPLAGTSSVRASQSAAEAGELDGALDDARAAKEIQPWAATPSLQQALVLELRGDLSSAAAAARQATADEPTNWRTWLVLSRIEAYRGNPAESVAAYREARSLNPRSALFDR
jgi:O-antigen ligase